MARSGSQSKTPQRGQSSKNASARQSQPRRQRHGDEAGIIPVLARAVREIESAAERGKVGPSSRTKFQVVALLVREERARAKKDPTIADPDRSELLKRLDGVATILAKTAARDTSLIQLLADDATVSDSARRLRRDMLMASGIELSPDELIIGRGPDPVAPSVERQVIPQSVVARQLSNPFLAP